MGPAVMPGAGMQRPGFPGVDPGFRHDPTGGGMQRPGFPSFGDPGGMQRPGFPSFGDPGGMPPPTKAPQPPGGGAVGAPAPDWGVSAGRMAEAQRLAGLGQMGRAKQQWELGGGDWGKGAHQFLRG